MSCKRLLQLFIAFAPQPLARFLQSELWRKCGLSRVPEMLAEVDYKKPSSSGMPSSNEWKVSFTDVEETAQWLSGTDITSAIFESLLTFKSADRSPHAFLVYNTPCYDACVERCLCIKPTASCLADKPICTASWTSSNDVLAFMQKSIVNCLVEQWKGDKGPLFTALNEKYKPWNEATAALENTLVTTPDFKLCKLIDQKLVLPQEVRERFLRDPVRSNEWRDVLRKFGAVYSTSSGGQPAATAEVAAAGVADNGQEPSAAPDAVSCDQWFPAEPQNFDAFKAQYPRSVSFDHSNGKCFFAMVDIPVEGEPEVSEKKLFLVGKEAVTLGELNDGYLLGHAGGTWYQAAKAIKFVKDNPGKGYIAEWSTDEVLCVLEKGGQDGKPAKLRDILHEIESQGTVNFELSGHHLERPPEVINGTVSDQSATQCLPHCGLTSS